MVNFHPSTRFVASQISVRHRDSPLRSRSTVEYNNSIVKNRSSQKRKTRRLFFQILHITTACCQCPLLSRCPTVQLNVPDCSIFSKRGTKKLHEAFFHNLTRPYRTLQKDGQLDSQTTTLIAISENLSANES